MKLPGSLSKLPAAFPLDTTFYKVFYSLFLLACFLGTIIKDAGGDKEKRGGILVNCDGSKFDSKMDWMKVDFFALA